VNSGCQRIGQTRGRALIPEVSTADGCFYEAFRGEERGVSWWMIAALVVFDVYVVSLAIIAWAISSAPLIPNSQVL